MRLKQMKIILFMGLLLLFVAAACSFGPLAGESISNNESPAEVQQTTAPLQAVPQVESTPIVNLQTTQSPLIKLEIENLLVDLYQRVNPSVVHILVYTNRNDALPLGSGSGFVFDSTGRVVTNNHVVEDGNDFEVVFSDGSRRWAEVIGTDVDSDLAVVQVESLPPNIPPVVLGDSDQLRVGQFVIAIGNPFGEQGSMSLGIISGLGRSLESQRQLDNTGGRYSLPQVIQTDAPINPGNSGGPLLNLAGEVVGVNSAIRTTTGVNSGVGFSIPVNAVRRVIPKLIEEGQYIYAYMGVQIQSLNLNLQDQLGLPRPSGAYVTGITPNGPADDAGLIPAQGDEGRGGDLIVAIDGQPVQDTEQLISYLVFEADVGQTVELTVLRDGETITLPLTLGARP
jgi:2-alkenal reductase